MDFIGEHNLAPKVPQHCRNTFHLNCENRFDLSRPTATMSDVFHPNRCLVNHVPNSYGVKENNHEIPSSEYRKRVSFGMF